MTHRLSQTALAEEERCEDIAIAVDLKRLGRVVYQLGVALEARKRAANEAGQQEAAA